MRSMLKLALVTGVPLVLFTTPAFAQGPEAPPPPPPPPPAADAPAAPPPPPVTVKTEVATTTTAPVADGTVQVHIKTKELVVLERRGSDNVWTTACETPCDARLPVGDDYRMVGPGLNDSKVFHLGQGKDGVVTLHFRPGVKKKEKTGEYMAIGGGILFVGGVVGGLIAASPSSVFNSSGTSNDYNFNVIAVGTGIALAGLVTGLVGVSWWVDNSHSLAAGDIQTAQPARGDLEPRVQTGMRMSSPTNAGYTTTIFSTTF